MALRERGLRVVIVTLFQRGGATKEDGGIVKNIEHRTPNVEGKGGSTGYGENGGNREIF
jgi:hypothetical protein